MMSLNGGAGQDRLNYETWIVYLLYAVMVLTPIHVIAGDVCLGLAILICVIKERRPMHLGKLQYLVLAFMGWGFLGIIHSPVPDFTGLSWLYRVGMYGAVYFLMYRYMRGEEQLKTSLRLLMLTGIVVCCIGIYQYIYVASEHVHEWIDAEHFPKLMRRMYSTLLNPNLFGEYLLMLLAIGGTGVLDALRKKRWKLAAWLGPTCFLFLICLVLTYSRGMWISLVFIVLYWGIIWERRLLWSLLLIPAILLFYHGEVAGRLWSLFSGQDTSAMMRWALWDSTLYMIEDHFLIGSGWDTFLFVYPDYNYFIQGPEVVMYHAHNLYLNMFAEVGIPGGVLFLTVLVGHGIVVGKTTSRAVGRTLQYGLGALLVGVLVSGLFDHTLYSKQISMIFWQLLGLGAAMVSYEQDSSLNKEEKR